MNIEHWPEAAQRKADNAQREEVAKAKLFARCIADEFEQRGLVVQLSKPSRLDNPDSPNWTMRDC